jgi:hypothetical protein
MAAAREASGPPKGRRYYSHGSPGNCLGLGARSPGWVDPAVPMQGDASYYEEEPHARTPKSIPRGDGSGGY